MSPEVQAKAREAERTANRVRRDTARRDELIRELHAAGMTLRDIGALVKMTAPGIKRVLDRG